MPVKRIAVVAGLMLAGTLALSFHLTAGSAVVPSGVAGWQEIRWPFPMDQWGEGRAFRCDAAHCGMTTTLYLRPKIGFCNCTDGVSDDAELDRLSDFDFMRGNVTPRGAGHIVRVAALAGRGRTFGGREEAADATALSIALNSQCDAMVATATVERSAAHAEPAVVEFLGSAPVQQWIRTRLGG